MGRSPCCSKVGLRRGPWSAKEDAQLTDYIQQHGEGQWRSLPKQAGLLRCGKSCRLRWMNYLRPGIVRGNISEDEEDLIVRLHGLLGNRWSLIAGRLPGRTDNEIKNYWNTHLLKKLNKNKPLHGDDNNNNNNHITNTRNKNDNDSVSAKKRKKKVKAVKDQRIIEPNDPPKIKVYLPKPIRLSSSSSESLSRSSSDAAAAAAADVARRPTTANSYENGEGYDYMGCNIMAVNELDQMYDEYLQQLLLI